MSGHAVVVGYDGSERALLAVRWAAKEAATRRCGLAVVEAIGLSMAGPPLVPGMASVAIEDAAQERVLHKQAEGRLAELATDVRRTWPDLEVRTRVESGRAAEVLVRCAGRAELVVIGSSGRSALPRILLGSTAAELLHTSDRPVVVVRPAATPAETRRVVVGVDGSDLSKRAIEFGYDFADRHGCELVAVHAWSDLPMDALEPVRAWDEDWQRIQQEGDRLLAESLGGHAEKYPDVAVRRVVGLGRPAHTLLEEAEGAALLVVGSHGRGTLGGMLLGSVSHAAVYHAPCPVAVVRGRQSE
jgi:nucleotide-binding universal stress UspA family protein